MFKGVLAGRNPAMQLLYLGLLALFGASVCYSIGLLLVNGITEVDLLENPEKLSSFDEHPSLITGYRILLVFQHLGMFILPALLFPYLIGRGWTEYMRMNRMDLTRGAFTLLIMFFFFPVSNYLAEMNAGMELPGSLSWLEERFEAWEENARDITERLLAVEGWQGLMGNLLLVAVLPAVGEELIFRGAIQRNLERMSGNYHLAIWGSAILFSAMHMQFYGFLPRFALGALFGYMLVFSGTIWVPILAHFLNNAAAVLFSFLFDREEMLEKVEEAGGQEGQGIFVFLSLFIVVGLLLLGKSWFRKGSVGPPPLRSTRSDHQP